MIKTLIHSASKTEDLGHKEFESIQEIWDYMLSQYYRFIVEANSDKEGDQLREWIKVADGTHSYTPCDCDYHLTIYDNYVE